MALDPDTHAEIVRIGEELRADLAWPYQQAVYPEHWTVVYRVRRGFVVPGTTIRTVRDEILIPDSAYYWSGLEVPEWWETDGYLERVTTRTRVLRCPCPRLWATVEAFAVHGCADLPPDADTVQEVPARQSASPAPGTQRASGRALYAADDVERACYELRANGEDDRMEDIDRKLRGLKPTAKGNRKNVKNALMRAIPPRSIAEVRARVDRRIASERM